MDRKVNGSELSPLAAVAYPSEALPAGALCTLLGAVALLGYFGFLPLPRLVPESQGHSPLLSSHTFWNYSHS